MTDQQEKKPEVAEAEGMPPINWKKIGLMGGAVVVVVVVAAVFMSHHHRKVVQHRAKVAQHHANKVGIPKAVMPQNTQLSTISSQLDALAHQLSNNQAYVNLDKVQQSLAQLQHQLQNMTASSNAEITKQIHHSTAQLQKQLTGVKHTMERLMQKQHHRQLAPSNLPFKVISIDTIQQANVVTVSFDHRFLPLDIGDSLSGWQLMKAKADAMTAEFKNDHQQYVTVDLRQAHAKK